MPEREERPRAFTHGSEGGTGIVFRDWDSGMVVEKYVGLYVCWDQHHDQWLMNTWFDRTTGERAVRCVRRWAGWREEERHRG